MLPLQQLSELHQKDLRIIPYFVQIPGSGLRHVLEGGHVLGLKSNRQVFGVQTVIFSSTYRYSSHTAVQTFRNKSISQIYAHLTDLWTFD